MFIIAGYTKTAAEKRHSAVQAFNDVVTRARKANGCLDLSINAVSEDAERINVFELRRDQDSLNAWRKVASPPVIQRCETYVELYRTDRLRSHFPYLSNSASES